MRATCLVAVWLCITASELVNAGSMDSSYGLAVRAVTLYEEYRKNPIAAEARYGGKRVSIGGTVGRIGIDEDVGIPYVILVAHRLDDGIKCVFPRDAIAKLATLKPGTLIAISGIVQGRRREFSDQIILQDCRI